MSVPVNINGMGTCWWRWANNRRHMPANPERFNVYNTLVVMARARHDYDPKLYSLEHNRNPEYNMHPTGDFKAGDWVTRENLPGVRMAGPTNMVLNKGLYALIVYQAALWEEIVVKNLFFGLKEPGNQAQFGNIPGVKVHQETFLHLYLMGVKTRPQGNKPHVWCDITNQWYRIVELMGPQSINDPNNPHGYQVVKAPNHADIVRWVRDNKQQ